MGLLLDGLGVLGYETRSKDLEPRRTWVGLINPEERVGVWSEGVEAMEGWTPAQGIRLLLPHARAQLRHREGSADGGANPGPISPGGYA